MAFDKTGRLFFTSDSSGEVYVLLAEGNGTAGEVGNGATGSGSAGGSGTSSAGSDNTSSGGGTGNGGSTGSGMSWRHVDMWAFVAFLLGWTAFMMA